MSKNKTVGLHHPPERTEFKSQPAPAVGILDWLGFIPFILGFLVTLIIHDVIEKFCYLFIGMRAQEWSAKLLNRNVVRLLKVCTGAQFDVTSDAQIDLTRPCILIGNHQSLFDMPQCFRVLAPRSPKFISKIELGKWIPGVSFHLRRGGNALIDRTDSDQALKAIDDLAQRVKNQNLAVVIFPEGTRARRGVLKHFKTKGALTLLDTCPNAQVIPMTIDGSWKLSAYSFGPIPRKVRTKIHVGNEIDRARFRTPHEVVAEAERIIQETLERFRSEAHQLN